MAEDIDPDAGVGMPSRRAVIGAAVLLLPSRTQAQGAALIGTWQGDVPGVGASRLIITAVSPSGQVEGRMEFDLRSYTSTFADKPDSVKNTSHGVASGSMLLIEAALGGRYELTLQGNKLNGVYTRGTTYRVDVTFTKSQS
jgi:hypothetical protein